MKKRPGHYCKVCGRRRANEKFSGKGHASHICKDCAKLPLDERNEKEVLTRIENLLPDLSKGDRTWLERKRKDRRPAVRAAAQAAYDLRFSPRKWTVAELETEDAEYDLEFTEDDLDEINRILEYEEEKRGRLGYFGEEDDLGFSWLEQQEGGGSWY